MAQPLVTDALWDRGVGVAKPPNLGLDGPSMASEVPLLCIEHTPTPQSGTLGYVF